MSTDRTTLTQELAALMETHNRWTARVARLRRQARALGAACPEEDSAAVTIRELEEQLAQARAELQEAQTAASVWEQKARQLSQVLYKERSERSRRIRELEQELLSQRVLT